MSRFSLVINTFYFLFRALGVPVSLANRDKLRRAQALEPKAAAKLRKTETDLKIKQVSIIKMY